MPLTIADRKHQMPFGAQKEVAAEQAVDPGYVSKVMNDEVFPKTPVTRAKLRRVRVALARKLGRPVDDVFPQTNQEAARPMAAALLSRTPSTRGRIAAIVSGCLVVNGTRRASDAGCGWLVKQSSQRERT